VSLVVEPAALHAEIHARAAIGAGIQRRAVDVALGRRELHVHRDPQIGGLLGMRLHGDSGKVVRAHQALLHVQQLLARIVVSFAPRHEALQHCRRELAAGDRRRAKLVTRAAVPGERDVGAAVRCVHFHPMRHLLRAEEARVTQCLLDRRLAGLVLRMIEAFAHLGHEGFERRGHGRNLAGVTLDRDFGFRDQRGFARIDVEGHVETAGRVGRELALHRAGVMPPGLERRGDFLFATRDQPPQLRFAHRAVAILLQCESGAHGLLEPGFEAVDRQLEPGRVVRGAQQGRRREQRQAGQGNAQQRHGIRSNRCSEAGRPSDPGAIAGAAGPAPQNEAVTKMRAPPYLQRRWPLKFSPSTSTLVTKLFQPAPTPTCLLNCHTAEAV
jgi:hypothetical protein